MEGAKKREVVPEAKTAESIGRALAYYLDGLNEYSVMLKDNVFADQQRIDELEQVVTNLVTTCEHHERLIDGLFKLCEQFEQQIGDLT